MGRLITESGTSRAIVAANRGEITYFPFNVSAESLVVDTFVSADAISTNTLSANAIVGKWEGLPLESYQVNIEGIDIKATDVPPNRYLKTNYEGVVAWVEETPVDVNNITGDLTVNGNISASGNLSANNIDVTNAILSGGTNINDLFGPGGTLSGIGGGGSANTVAKFSDSTTIADSNISDDGSTVTIAADITSGNLLNITNDEVSKFSVSADGSTTIQGNLSVHGDMHYIDTLVTVTSALSIINSGTGPGLTVEQKGTDEPIAHFIDKEGGEIMFDDTGQIGIGIKTPDQKLTVAGGISASEGLTAANIYSDGRVGINTNTPDYMLDVAGSVGIGACLIHNGDDDTFIHFTDDDINIQAGGVNFIDITQDTTNEITFNEAGADVDFRAEGDSDTHLLFVDAGNDKVGIGTDAPDYKLDVAGDIGMNQYLYHNGDGDTYLRFAPNTVNLVAGGKSALKYEASTGKILINNTNQDVDFQVMADGGNVLLHTDAGTERVGINTTSPGEALTVAGGISAGEGLSAKNIDSAYSILSAGTDLIDIFAPTTGGGYIDGSGTANTIAKFSDSNTIANSNITDDGSTVKVSAPLSGDDYIKGHQFCLGANSRVDNPATNNLGLYANNELGLELVSDTRVCSHHDLTVNGTISASSNLSAGGRFFAPNGSAAAPTFSFSDFPGTGLLMADTDTLGIATRGSVRMAVDESGCVGIGTTSPTANFQVHDGGIYAGNGATKGYGFHDFGTGWGYKGVTGPSRLGIFTDTVERITVASNGKVGIGVTNPGVTLTVQGGISASGGLSAGNLDLVGGSGTTNFIPKFTDPDTLGDSIAYIGSDNINIEGGLSALQGLSADNNIYGGGCVNHFVNNVGINIANPSEKLTIQGALSSSNKGVFDRIGIGVSTPNAQLHVSNSGAPTFRLSRTGTGQIWQQSIDSSGRFLLLEAASEGGTQYTRFGIDDAGDTCLVPVAGNVGVGTTSPEAKLTVQGNISADGTLSASGDIDVDGDLYLDGNIYLDEDQRIFFEEDQATWIETDSADRLRFVAGGKQMLLLDQDTGDRAVFGFGTKVGINIGNNTTPASYLTVAGDISASEGLSAGKTSFFADKVGINTAAPNKNLTVAGDISATGCYYVPDTGQIRVGDGGDLVIQHDGNYSYITEQGQNDLFIQPNNSSLYVRDAISGNIMIAAKSGSGKIVELYAGGSKKLATNSSGVTVTGDATINGSVSASDGLSANNLDSAFNILSAGTDLTDIFGPGGSAGNVDGSGTGGKIPVWSDSNTLGDSPISSYGVGIKVTGDLQWTGNATNAGNGNVVMGTGCIKFADDGRIAMGDSNDLLICHSGSHSIICENGTGGLKIMTGDLYLRTPGDVDMIYATSGGAAKLYYDGSEKLATTNTGVTVAGTISSRGYCSVGTDTIFGTQALNATSTGGQNTAIGLQAMLANTSGYQNVAVGEAALSCNTEGLRNTAVGCGAAFSNTTGDNNVAIGCRAGYSNQTSNSIVAIGTDALYNNLAAENVAVGTCAANANTTGLQNVAIGHRAMCSNTTGCCNVAVGFNALQSSLTASGNVAVGNNALCANTTGDKNVAVGNHALATNTEAWYNVAIGHCTLNANTTGEYNVGIGRQPLNANTTGVHNIGIGRQALWCNTTGCHNIALGQSSLYCNETGCYNVAIGGCAMNCNIGGYFNVALGCGTMYHANSGYHNNAIGYLALHCNFGGHGNNAFGRDALGCTTTGNCNDAMGYRALYKNTTGSSNVAIGAFSMSNAAPGDYNVAVGKYSLYNNTSTRNTALGYYALYNNTAGDNTAVGYSAASNNTSGYYNVAVGRGALTDNQTGNNNTAIGYCAMHENEADNNTGLGMWAMLCNTSGSRNTAIGRSALECNTTADGNTAVGYHAVWKNTTGACNTGVGEWALCSNTTGCRNVALGADAMCLNTTGDFNTSVGYQSMYDNISGYQNVALGYAALGDNTKGHNNVAIGESALRKNIEAGANTAVGKSAAACNTTGACNAALGYQALNRNTTGDKNTSLGACALFSNTVGSCNVGVGYHSLLQATTATNNVAMGTSTLYSNIHGDCNTAIGHQALYSNKCGNNTAVGFLALNANTTGYYNTAVGSLANRCNTTGIQNTSVGMYAMHSNTTADSNTALGYGALFSNDEGNSNTAVGSSALCKTTANANTAVGTSALICTTTGGCNTAMGNSALLKNCAGSFNIGIGSLALCANSSGCYNTAMGYSASRLHTTGCSNASLGYQTLYSNTVGDENTAIGMHSFYNSVSGSKNIAVGFAAAKTLADGSTALTAPGNSTYLGVCTRGKATDDDNVTVIGYCACACGDNTVSIGNANVTDTYINGCTSVVGDISASGNGYFTCVIAGGYFEEKAAHPSLAEHPTGSLVVIGEDGNLTLSTSKNDKKIFGVTQKGACQPIILGAEPVLVTGSIKAGDFITTSDKQGHGMKTPNPIWGSVIAQSMEDGTGDSHLVQAMIRKL